MNIYLAIILVIFTVLTVIVLAGTGFNNVGKVQKNYMDWFKERIWLTMAKVHIKTITEGNIDKYDAFRALCEELGLDMLINDNLSDYFVEDRVLYENVDISYHGSPIIKKEVVSEDYRMVTLFECLQTIKSLI